MEYTIKDFEKFKEKLFVEYKITKKNINKLIKDDLEKVNSLKYTINDNSHILAIMNYNLANDFLDITNKEFEKVEFRDLYFSDTYLLWHLCKYPKKEFDKAIKIFKALDRDKDIMYYMPSSEISSIHITDEKVSILIAPNDFEADEKIFFLKKKVKQEKLKV